MNNPEMTNQCSFTDFMQALKPWLNEDYIQHARVDEAGNFTLTFVNGGQQIYRVDECTATQINEAVALLKKNGVQVFE